MAKIKPIAVDRKNGRVIFCQGKHNVIFGFKPNGKVGIVACPNYGAQIFDRRANFVPLANFLERKREMQNMAEGILYEWRGKQSQRNSRRPVTTVRRRNGKKKQALPPQLSLL